MFVFFFLLYLHVRRPTAHSLQRCQRKGDKERTTTLIELPFRLRNYYPLTNMFRASRQLLAASKPAGKNGFVQTWLSDRATYPILLIMAGAMGVVAFQGQRIILNHPDVTFDKQDRRTLVRDNDDEAEKHWDHPIRAYARGEHTQVMPALNNMMVSSKVKA